MNAPIPHASDTKSDPARTRIRALAKDIVR